jgi:hypothetical protein
VHGELLDVWCPLRLDSRRRRGSASLDAPQAKTCIRSELDTGYVSIVQSRPETTRVGGVTGKGFTPGVSGNPGGRPKGLSRRVRELVGDDGHEIAEFMVSVMTDERARNADRIEAAKWLADRGFGKAPLVLDAGVSPERLLEEYFSKLSFEDLLTMKAILRRYSPDVSEVVETDEPSMLELASGSSTAG